MTPGQDRGFRNEQEQAPVILSEEVWADVSEGSQVT